MYYSNIVCGIGSGTWKTTKGKRSAHYYFCVVLQSFVVCSLWVLLLLSILLHFLKKGKWKNDDGAKGVCYLSREAEGNPTCTWLLKLR